ncbi:MAG TPA: ABC transporter ATP-binding protein [Acetobacteraceae bacterium]|nr:ABC transporter ATP-binding protein [Acetobacteraceae bacterium]
MAEPALQVSGLTRRFGHVTAVDRVDLTVWQGEFVTLLGPSGCGKTTTLNLIAGFIAPHGGTIRLQGRPVEWLPPFRRNLGLVFQDYALFPHMTVAENVGFGLRMRHVARAEVARRVADALTLVQLRGLGERRPHQLSGGQRQRVALARALVIRPAMLLLDEPLSNLDLKLREEMRVEISTLQRRLGIATVFVTHDQGEALTMSDRVAVMREGRIEQIGTASDIYERPATRFVASFIGAANLIDHDSHLVVVRPERLKLCEPHDAPPDARCFAAHIERVVYLGSRLEVRLRLADGTPLLADTINDGGTSWCAGDSTVAWFRPQDAWAIPRA